MNKYGLTENDSKIIDEILKKYTQIKEVIIFGSRAMNTFKASSDIDFAVKGEKISSVIGDIIADFEESDLIFEVDIVDYERISAEKLLEHINKYGKLYYRKGWDIAKNLPLGWRGTTLGEVAEYKTDKIEVSKLNIKNYISTENMIPNIGGVTYSSNMPNINTVNQFLKGDILFSNIRTYFKKLWFAKFNGGCSNDVLIIRANMKVIYTEFLFYLLSNEKFFDYTSATSKGTKMPRGDKDAILQYEIILPPLQEQKAIADVLSSLDEKIELLQEENKTLEELAQTIFKEWFVNFNFPGATGEMEESELGEIPKGWRVGELGEEAIEIVRGFTTSYVEKSNLINLNQKVNKGNYLDKQYFKYYPDDAVVPDNKFVKKFDVLLNSLGEGTLGRVHLYKENTNNVIADQHISILRFDDRYKFYIYNTLSSNEGQANLMNEISGSTGMTMLNINIVRNFKFIIPEDYLLINFSEITLPIYEKISYNFMQIETLSKTKETLLPKLMSGEIRVE